MADAQSAPDHLALTKRLNRLPIVSTHRRVVLAVGVGLFFDMYEVYLAGAISTALKSDFGLDATLLPYFLGSAFVGMFFGALLLGRLADRLGRRRAFLLNLGIYSLASLAGAFAQDPITLVITRFIAGVGVGAEFPVADTYLADILPKRLRGRWAARSYTFALTAVPVVGFASLWLLPLEPLSIPGWRWLLAGGALGSLLVMILRRGMPESPRWLASVGRMAEAERIVARMEAEAAHRRSVDCNDAAGAETDDDAQENSATVELPLTALFTRPYAARYYGWAVFHIMEVIGYYGFGTLAATVLIARGYDVTQSLLFVSLSFLGYPVGSALSVLLLDRFERKYLLMTTSFGMAAFGLLFGLSSVDGLIVAFGVCFTVTGQIFANTYHVYQAEIFPTSLRSTATSSTYALSRLSAGAMPFILLPLLHAGGAGTFFAAVAAAMLVIVVVVALIGPKTTGRSLEQINPIPPRYRNHPQPADAAAVALGNGS